MSLHLESARGSVRITPELTSAAELIEKTAARLDVPVTEILDYFAGVKSEFSGNYVWEKFVD